jgi:hypothetical protein
MKAIFVFYSPRCDDYEYSLDFEVDAIPRPGTILRSDDLIPMKPKILSFGGVTGKCNIQRDL